MDDRYRAPGAHYLGDDQCQFEVWAPLAGSLAVLLEPAVDYPVPMTRESSGYYHALLTDVPAGTRYHYLLNGSTRRADPASRFQPLGVDGPSEVVDPGFRWTDQQWTNPPLSEYVIYELHAGVFSAEGTLGGIVPRLSSLRELGVTAVELMPLAQFPGCRNWGYDGVFPYAVQNSYGGPGALKEFVNAAHHAGLAVVLDVVYNHLGPEGNYLREFGPYFTSHYRTPWGDAINFDGPDSDEVRRFFIGNALFWLDEFHVDALRLDAIHAIVDPSARPFVQELTQAVHQLGSIVHRSFYVIAESDLNDVRVVRPAGSGGLGCDAAWSDNFHHALHTLLTGERGGYYRDFGSTAQFATAWSEGFVYSGQYSPFRRRRHGNCARGTPGERFVVCTQNHDQIGNRARGDRLSAILDFDSLKLAAAAVLLSPFVPLLFMGEEYGETAPFPYFTSHAGDALIEAVRLGRRQEFAAFAWEQDLPDPQDEATFFRARLTPEHVWTPCQRMLRDFYRELLVLRRTHPALSNLVMEQCQATALDEQTLLVRRWHEADDVAILLHFGSAPNEASMTLPAGDWTRLLDSTDPQSVGQTVSVPAPSGDVRVTLQPKSVVLYERLRRALESSDPS